MDNLGSLKIFVQAAESLSFTEAGRRLGLSPSTIGKSIARMEEKLKVRLFNRSTRTISLTAEGVILLERGRRIFCEIEAIDLELNQTREAPQGRLRISLPLVGMLMMPTIAAFMHRWPQIELDLDFTDRIVDVIEEGFDAVVRTGEGRVSRLMTRTLGTFHHQVVAAPDYLARHGKPQVPDDLLKHACLIHHYPTTGKVERWPLRQNGEHLDLALPQAAVANTIEPLIYLAEQGLGIACVPNFAVRCQLKTGSLISVLDNHIGSSGTFRILWPSSRHLSPKLRVFIDFMATNLFSEKIDSDA